MIFLSALRLIGLLCPGLFSANLFMHVRKDQTSHLLLIIKYNWVWSFIKTSLDIDRGLDASFV